MQMTAYGSDESLPFPQAVTQSPVWEPDSAGFTKQNEIYQRFLRLLNITTLEEATQLPSPAVIVAHPISMSNVLNCIWSYLSRIAKPHVNYSVTLQESSRAKTDFRSLMRFLSPRILSVLFSKTALVPTSNSLQPAPDTRVCALNLPTSQPTLASHNKLGCL